MTPYLPSRRAGLHTESNTGILTKGDVRCPKETLGLKDAVDEEIGNNSTC